MTFLHRGVRLDLGPAKAEFDAASPEQKARILLAHTPALGQHWATEEQWARDWADQYAYQRLNDKVPAVITVAHPGEEHVETDPAWLKQHGVSQYAIAEPEVPIKSGAPLAVHKVAWYEHDDPDSGDGHWVEHTVTMRATAAVVASPRVVLHLLPEDDEEAAALLRAHAPQGTVGYVAGEWSREALHHIVSNHGFTVKDHFGDAPTSGYMVSIDKTSEQVFPLATITADDIATYRARHASALAAPNAYLGAWVEGGKAFLDVSTHVPTLDQAEALARQHHQIAVFDLTARTTVYIDQQRAAALDPGVRYEYEPGGGGLPHRMKAMHGTETVAWLDWDARAWSRGEILHVEVHPRYRRQGVATELLRRAREIDPAVHHGTNLTPDGRAWADKTSSLDPGWRPTKGMFSPGKPTLDPRVFDVATETMQPEVRDAVLRPLRVFWDAKYPGWEQWARVYLAGSAASYWYDSDGDFDTLIGIDVTALRQARPANIEVSEADIVAHLDRELKEELDPTTDAMVFAPGEKPVETTYFCNPDSFDINDIKPYAAYAMWPDEGWVVHPPVLPADWGPEKFAPELWQHFDQIAREAEEVLDIGDPVARHQACVALFDRLHSWRQESYSPHGKGWLDTGNVYWQALSQTPGRLLQRLYAVKHDPAFDMVPAVAMGYSSSGGGIHASHSEAAQQHRAPHWAQARLARVRGRGRQALGSPSGRVTRWRPVRRVRGLGGLQGQARPVLPSAAFARDLDHLRETDPHIHRLVTEHVEALHNGTAELSLKRRGSMAGTVTVAVHDDDGDDTGHRIGAYLTDHKDSPGHWVVYWAGPHNYVEAEKRLSSRYTVEVEWAPYGNPDASGGIDLAQTQTRQVVVEADSDHEATLQAAQIASGVAPGWNERPGKYDYPVNPIVPTGPKGMVTRTRILRMEAAKGRSIYRGITLGSANNQNPIDPHDVNSVVEKLRKQNDFYRRGEDRDHPRGKPFGSHWTTDHDTALEFALDQGTNMGQYRRSKDRYPHDLYGAVLEAHLDDDPTHSDLMRGYGEHEVDHPGKAKVKGYTVHVHVLPKWEPGVRRFEQMKNTHVMSFEMPEEMAKAAAHMRDDGTGHWDRSGPEPRWVQDHHELLQDALWSLKGHTSTMHIHLRDVRNNAPQPSSGSGKQMRAQAEALWKHLNDHGRTNDIPLYRGSHEEPGEIEAWSEDRKVAQQWARKGGGKVWVLQPGEGHGIRVADHITSGLDQTEKEWVVHNPNAKGWKLVADYRGPTREAPEDIAHDNAAIYLTGNPPQGSDLVREFAVTPAATDFFAGEADDLSRAYRDMPILDPSVVPLWQEMAELNAAQAAALRSAFTVVVHDDLDPYETAEEMHADIDRGIYQVTSLHSHHPVWTPEQNVDFRIVHDLLGHGVANSDFSLKGEVAAYQAQCKVVPTHLWSVLFTEIIAQAAYANTHHLFGEQKVGLIPLTQAQIDAQVGKIMDAADPAYDALHYSASAQGVPWTRTAAPNMVPVFNGTGEKHYEYNKPYIGVAASSPMGGGLTKWQETQVPVPWQGDVEHCIREAEQKAERFLKGDDFWSNLFVQRPDSKVYLIAGSGEGTKVIGVAHRLGDNWMPPRENVDYHEAWPEFLHLLASNKKLAWEQFCMKVADAQPPGFNLHPLAPRGNDMKKTVIYRGITLKMDEDPLTSTAEDRGKKLGSSWTLDFTVAKRIAERSGAGFSGTNYGPPGVHTRKAAPRPGYSIPQRPVVIRAEVDLGAEGIGLLSDGRMYYAEEQEVDVHPGTTVHMTGYMEATAVPVDQRAYERALEKAKADVEKQGFSLEDYEVRYVWPHSFTNVSVRREAAMAAKVS